MPATLPRQTRLVLAAAAAAFLLAGCGSLVNRITPYKVEVVQGNFVSKEQVDALQKGMSREQVKGILGSPLVTSLFHADRWDYVFTMKRQGVEPQKRQLAVFFKNDQMDHFEGDPMPSESEFVTTLDKNRKTGKVPRLEATEEELRRFPKSQPAAAPAPEPAPAAASTNYPPLESAPR